MAELLTDEWIAALAEAAASAAIDPQVRLVVQQVVTEPDGTSLEYAVRLADGRASVVSGRVDDADITFTQDRETATAIATAQLSAQAAFMAGRLRVGGNLQTVLERARELTELDDIFARARAAVGAEPRDA